MADILLIRPPLHPNEIFARGSAASASVLPPLGLAYLAAYLKQDGHYCKIIDGIVEPFPTETICRMAENFDVVGITVVTPYALRAIELIRAIKKKKKCPPIVVGGPHVTILPESILKEGADFAVVGEGEETFKELIAYLDNSSKRIKEVLGLAFYENGRILYTGNRKHIDPLDKVPLPARDMLPMASYHTGITRAPRQPSHSMLTSRGCPGRCSFCTKKTFGTNVRYFSPERIVEEFFLLRDKYGAKDIALLDDNFLANPSIVLAVCEDLMSRKLGITWSVESRIDSAHKDLLQQLKRAGCTYICYGIESGSQRLLNYLNKQITKDQIREVIRITKKIGLKTYGYFMLGAPTETAEEMEMTVQFAIELGLDIASFSIFTPLPGTLDYERAKNTGDFPDPFFFMNRIVPEHSFLDWPVYTPEGINARKLMAIHKSAYNRFYFRPSIILRKLGEIRTHKDMINLSRGAATLIVNFFNNPHSHL